MSQRPSTHPASDQHAIAVVVSLFWPVSVTRMRCVQTGGRGCSGRIEPRFRPAERYVERHLSVTLPRTGRSVTALEELPHILNGGGHGQADLSEVRSPISSGRRLGQACRVPGQPGAGRAGHGHAVALSPLPFPLRGQRLAIPCSMVQKGARFTYGWVSDHSGLGDLSVAVTVVCALTGLKRLIHFLFIFLCVDGMQHRMRIGLPLHRFGFRIVSILHARRIASQLFQQVNHFGCLLFRQ
jgi:hypothetical protein